VFDIGLGEIAIILVIALLVFGPDRLPTMAKQAASFIRDLRLMVAKARQDLSESVDDLGIDTKELKDLADLRNPKSFVRSKLLDGELDDLGLDEIKDEFDDSKAAKNNRAKSAAARKNGAKASTPSSRKSSTATNGAKKPATSTTTDKSADTTASTATSEAAEPDPTPVSVTTPRFDVEAT
jgi:Tat protein translocase TatB subunit